MPMRHRSEFLTSQEDVWDFRHVGDQQRESSGSWHRHRIADSHDGFGGRVRLHYEHRLLHGDDHALHNLDEHEDLTHLGCEGGALRARYAHGGSRGALLLGPHEPGRHRLTTLRVGSSWGCDAGVLPGGTPTSFLRVLRHDCLGADVGGCHHHHFRVEPAHLLEVFEDLHVDFRWRPSGGAGASAGAGASREGAATAAAPADARGLLGPSQAPPRQLAHNLPQPTHELKLNPPMKTEEEIEAACRGGVIPDSRQWWNCDGSVAQEHRRRRGQNVGRAWGPCVCPTGSWWGNKGNIWSCWTDLCDNMVDKVVGYDTSMYSGEKAAAKRCKSDLTPIPGSSSWSNCPVSGAYTCWPYCCCPKGQKYHPVMEVCCSCQDESGACNEPRINPAELHNNESIFWGLNYDKAKNPPVKKQHLAILFGLFFCEDCYAVAAGIDVDFQIRLFKLTLHTFLINVTMPVEFSMTFKLLGGDGVNMNWTRQNHVLAKVSPSFISLSRLLDIHPFLGLSSFSSGHAYVNTPFPEFYIRTTAPSVWNFGYSYDRTAQPSHVTILDIPWDTVEHNLYDFIKECGMLLVKDWNINISTHIDAAPSIEVGLDINGLTDVGASLQVPMPIDFEAEFNFTGLNSWAARFLDWVKSPFSSGRRLAPHAQARAHSYGSMFATTGRRYELQSPRTPAENSWRPSPRRLGAAGRPAAEARALDAAATGVAEPEDESPEDGVPILPYFASRARAGPGAGAALCFDLLLAAGAPPGRSVKLVAEVPPGYRWESRTRPAADDQSSLALSGCTARMSSGQLASLSEMTFKVVHDDLADRLGSSQTERKNFQQGIDSLASEGQNLTAEGIDRELAARAAVDLIADLVRMLSPVLQSESVDIGDVLLADPPGSAGDSRSTWTFGSLVAGIRYRPFDGPLEGAAASEVLSGGPSAPAIAVLAGAAAGSGGGRPEAEAWRDGEEEEEREEDDEGRRLFINLSMLYGMEIGMKSNGILIGKAWIFNAMDVMKGLLLGVALASARGVDWLWDTTMDWVQEHIPGDSWHVRTVGAMFQGVPILNMTDISELLDLDVCGLTNSVLLFFELDPQPCWLLLVAVIVLLVLVLYVWYLFLKHCTICGYGVSCCKACLRCLNRFLPCLFPCWSKAYNDLPQGAFEDYDSNLEDHITDR